MLYLDENFRLDSDKYNFILQEKKIVQDKDSKNYGQEVWENRAYCGHIKDVLNYIIRKKIKANMDTLKSVQEAIIATEEIFDKLLEADRKGRGNL